MLSSSDIDITKNIKLIESFQCQLLNTVAELFTSLADAGVSNKERADILSNIVILTYLLADRLGISYTALDAKVLNNIKLGILDENGSGMWQTELSALAKHIDKNRNMLQG